MHLLIAVQQALLARADDSLKTKTLHSEILWMLAPGTNVRLPFVRCRNPPRHVSKLTLLSRRQITEALKHFGLSPSTSSLVVVHIARTAGGREGQDEDEEVLRRMEAAVEGEVVSLDALGRIQGGALDDKAVRKVCFPLRPLGIGSSHARRRSSRSPVRSCLPRRFAACVPLPQVYKLNSDPALKGLQAGSDDARETLDRLVCSSVALKVAM